MEICSIKQKVMADIEIENVMIGLINSNIKKVIVYYDGGGDDGAISEIFVSTDPDIEFDDIDTWDNGIPLIHVNRELYDVVDDFCTEKLLQDIENWWDGQGGSGSIRIDVELGTYTIHNTIETTEVMNPECEDVFNEEYYHDDYYHSGNLYEKNIK